MQSKIDLLEKDFTRLSTFIFNELGIKMPPAKKVLLESRLQKRLHWLDIASFSEYCDFLISPAGRNSELTHFIDKITTNKTDFFREPDHFDYLINTILPRLTKTWNRQRRQLKVWSAGCSTGEEPYTLAMVLNEFMRKNPQIPFDFKIIGTDISMDALNTANLAVYNETRVEPVPLELKKRYLLKSKQKEKQLIKIDPSLRNKVEFSQLNFMDSGYPLKQMDIIFCRNVIIYFNKETQEETLKKLCNCIKPDGYFFQGHSESIQGFGVPLRIVHPTIYQKT